MLKRVYLSGQFEDGPALRRQRHDLLSSGIHVTSRWLDAESFVPATASADEAGAPARLASIASQDIEDIHSADVVVVFNPREASSIGRGGRHVETGYALALGKQVIVVGVRSNVFHWLPEVTVIDDWDRLLEALR